MVAKSLDMWTVLEIKIIKIKALLKNACKKTVDGVRDKIMSLFKTNTIKNYSKPRRISNMCGGRKKPRKSKNQMTK